MPSQLRFRRLNSARPAPDSRPRRILERLPDPHLTRSSAPFPDRSPRRSSANAASGWFDACPRRADAGGPTSLHLSRSTAYEKTFLAGLQRTRRTRHRDRRLDLLVGVGESRRASSVVEVAEPVGSAEAQLAALARHARLAPCRRRGHRRAARPRTICAFSPDDQCGR